MTALNSCLMHLELLGNEKLDCKFSVLSVTGKTLSCEPQSAILHIASTKFCILTVITFVDLKKKNTQKTNHISEIKVYQQNNSNKK